MVLALTLGWSFIGTGLYALWRRPDQLIGRLMMLVGFLWFIGACRSPTSALVFTVGLALGGLWAGPLVHLLVAFPTGRVEPARAALVRLGYGIPLRSRWRCCSPPSPLRTARLPGEPAARRDSPTAATSVRALGAAGDGAARGRVRRARPALAALRPGPAAGAGAGAVDRRGGRGRRRRGMIPQAMGARGRDEFATS